VELAEARRKYVSLGRMTVAAGCTPQEADTAARLREQIATRFPVVLIPEHHGESIAEYIARIRREDAEAVENYERRRAAAAAPARKQPRAKAGKSKRPARTAAAPAAEPRAPQSATYRWEYRKCGKPGCHCATDKGHGPYRYAKRRDGTTVRSVYGGRKFRP
jgi:hypothetical protein